MLRSKRSLSRPSPGTRLKRGLCPDSKRGQSIFTLAICNIFHAVPRDARKPGAQIIIVLLFSPAEPSSCLHRFPQSTTISLTLARRSVATVSRTGPSCGSVVAASRRKRRRLSVSVVVPSHRAVPRSINNEIRHCLSLSSSGPSTTIPGSSSQGEQRAETTQTMPAIISFSC